MKNIIYWIWLSLVFESRNKESLTLLRAFDFDPEAIWKADDSEIAEILYKHKCPQHPRELDEATSIYNWCQRNNIGLLSFESPEYPAKLKEIIDPPILLYYRGTLPNLNQNLCVACVGTRRMTEYGKHSSYKISYDLAKAGAIVISGMAKGVDGICHRAALDALGSTIAVLGCGIDRIYPPENHDLYNEIVLKGAVITEYKPSSPPNSFHFPQRNRIISGLSDCTLVLEADESSGALITAKYAAAHGRMIASLPGRIGEMNSRGTNDLIKTGAKTVTEASDITDEFKDIYKIKPIPKSSPFVKTQSKTKKISASQNLQYAVHAENAEIHYTSDKNTRVNQKASKQNTNKTTVQENVPPAVTSASVNTNQRAASEDITVLTPNERRVYDSIPENEAVSADFISEKGIPISDILVALTMLEIKNLIEALPGGMYKRIR